MSRGKPPRIRRKLSRSEPTLFGKRAIAELGDIAVAYEQYSLIHTLLVLEQLRPHRTKNNIFYDWTDIDNQITTLFKAAVCALDTKFFDRCILIIKWFSEGRPPPDPRGAAILRVVFSISDEKPQNGKISSHEVAMRVQRDTKHELILEPKDVRDIWADMGMGKFPVSVATFKKQILTELKHKYPPSKKTRNTPAE